MEFSTAQRSAQKALIGLYGPSGCGKTYSALLMAKGFAKGDMSKVCFIDTENGRGTHYADDPQFEGYGYGEIKQPFSSQKYIDALTSAENAGYEVIIIDSLSHEWDGPGGCLDQHAEAVKKNPKGSLPAWAKVKAENKKLMYRLMGSKCHIIACLRGKDKVKPMNGQVVNVGMQAIQESTMLFEFLCFIQVIYNQETGTRSARIEKCYNTIQQNIPQTPMITEEWAKAFIDWCDPKPPKTDEEIEREALEKLWACNSLDELTAYKPELSRMIKPFKGTERHARIIDAAQKASDQFQPNETDTQGEG